ncbi:MAG TPA: hypothetical protein VGZ47_08990 [Gemmataceae bacterium]|nr:hypothetical protein [Gemmataceae bacterium]
MFALILTILVIAVALLVLCWTGTLLAQGYFYDSPVEKLYWRAPAAAGALTLFFAFWAWIEYRWPNSTGTIFNFVTEESQKVDQFWSVRRSASNEEERILFKKNPGTNEYRDANNRRWVRSSSGMMVAIVIEEKDKEGKVEEKRFDAEMSNGNFAPRKSSGMEMPVRYFEEGGSRYIDETNPGEIIRDRKSRLVASLTLNIVHFAVWFVVLWLLLHFQWPHALGFAFVCWLAMTLAVVPYLHDTARKASARPRTLAAKGQLFAATTHRDFADAPIQPFA